MLFRKTDPNAPPKPPKSKSREWVDSLLFAVIAATLIRWATFEAYVIPSPSMEHSLLVSVDVLADMCAKLAFKSDKTSSCTYVERSGMAAFAEIDAL